MPSIVARWEWRTFGDRFPDMEARVASQPHDFRTSQEIYLVSALSGANVKIRDGVLDVKLLQRIDRGLELWIPVLKAPFPVGRDTCDAVFGYWQVVPPSIERPQYTLEQFLGEVVAQVPDVSRIDVTKERRGIEVDGCKVEVANLTIRGRRTMTVAVEHEDPERVLVTVGALGLADADNTNYVKAMKSMLEVPVS